MLLREIAELKAERRQILDYLQVNSLGTPMFEKVAQQPQAATPKQTLEPLSEQDQFSADVAEARRRGYVKPRAIADFITRQNVARARDAQVRAATEQKAANSAEAAVVADFDAAEAEGRAAVEQS